MIALNNLIKAVNILTVQCREEHAAIDALRHFLENCELCKQPPQQRVPTCATHPPSCFPGVHCHDTSEGPRCGSCPQGYTGNGYECTRTRSCRDNNPCFPGSECIDSEQGPRCGPCPRGYEGNGEQCTRTVVKCREHNPCFPGVECRDSAGGPTCGPCPRGYEGNGQQCARRSGCEYNPCHPGELDYEYD